MATAKLFLDSRYANKDTEKQVTVKIAVNHRGKSAALPTEIKVLPSQWDSKDRKVKSHPKKALFNRVLLERLAAVTSMMEHMNATINLSEISASELCKLVKEELNPKSPIPLSNVHVPEDTKTVKIWFDKWMSHKSGRTKDLYQTTRNRIVAWIGEEAFGKLHFEDINRDWLLNFDDFMAQTAPSANSRAINMRNLRTVCNYAIDNDVTTHYPFRRFKIESEATKKRNLDIATLRRLFKHKCEEEWQQRYLDAFKLSFMLIGINMVDLCKLTEVKNGRIEYIRSKTGKTYDIKVEAEALALLDKYQGKGQLLNYLDSCTDYRHFYNRMCIGLREIRNQLGIDELTSYYARHSWATIASKLDISHDTIARALGHGGNTVTDIYIQFDMAKVDEANRKVLDYVLYGVSEAPTVSKKRGRPRKK